MKYQNVTAFEKHLEQAAKVQLSRVFLVVAGCSYERKKIVDRIVDAIRSREGRLHFHTQEGAQIGLEDVLRGLNTGSLLEGKQVLYLDGVDKCKKNALALLGSYIANPSPFAYLVLGASSGKGFGDFSKKELITCDLSQEKPWERKERLKRMLSDVVAKSGKSIQGDALEYLLENVGLNLPGLEMEIDKLITYAGQRSQLHVQDVLTLCSTKKSATLWQLSEEIVWKESFPPVCEEVDASLLFPLLSQLHTQLEQALSLCLLLERGMPREELHSYFPTVKPNHLEKMLPVARARKSSFFKRALDLLFDTELMAKNSSLDPALILDLLLTKLTILKKHHALSASQPSL